MREGVAAACAIGVELCHTTLNGDEQQVCDAWAILSDDERQRADRGSPVVRRRRALSRAALRTVLGRYVGCAPQALRFRYGVNGKPMLADADGVAFSLSTSRDHCLIAVGKVAGLGVDVEHLAPIADADRIAARSFAPEDAATIAAQTGAGKLLAFYSCWTRGEAYVKGRGLGLADGPAPLSVPDDGWTIQTLSPGDDMIAALAVSR
jgi:4'-phosphopantetheinyl transferase